MRELVTMWRSTRMVVFTAISAALYAAALVAFKFLSILPGVTEIRPGVALVVLCSLLFGPAGAWGAAIGNTIGDLAGGLGPGTAIGFLANLLFGLVPYKLYRALGIDDPTPRSAADAVTLGVVGAAASATCAIVVGFGIQAVGLWPIAFRVLANTVFVTNTIVCATLGAYLVRAIYPRAAALGLRYQDVMDLRPAPRTVLRRGAAVLAVLAIGAALLLGDARELGYLGAPGPDLALVVCPPLLVSIAALAWID